MKAKVSVGQPTVLWSVQRALEGEAHPARVARVRQLLYAHRISLHGDDLAQLKGALMATDQAFDRQPVPAV